VNAEYEVARKGFSLHLTIAKTEANCIEKMHVKIVDFFFLPSVAGAA
jgi:hypothetical protein